MYKAFEIAGHNHDVVDNKFPGMINAFKFGALLMEVSHLVSTE